MIEEWNLVWKVAGGGYGICILVLIILSLVAWALGLIVQKTTPKAKEDSTKANKG